MRYLPHTPSEVSEMLQAIGVQETKDLFATIPSDLRLNRPLNLPPPLSEIELKHQLREISRNNAHGEEWVSLLGGGAYSHFIPSAVGQLLLRGEFLTAYTPYQAEVSQGTLQAIFEYQTMVAEILGMEIANASNYDGSTATAEAVLMALRLTDRHQVLVARSVHPEYREVLKTYLKNQPAEILEIPFTQEGRLDRSGLSPLVSQETACLVVGTPNFFGIVEDFSDLASTLHSHGALLITSSPEPVSLGIFKSPGEMGADIAVAEGQGLGNPLNFGGPYLGMFATRRDFVRALPGRIVGETTDANGQRGFVLTLATREQHIRRERATSNICTNVSLCALATTMTLALWGKEGFRKLSQMNYHRAHQLKKRIASLKGFSLPFSGTTFNEFVVKLPGDVDGILKKLREEKILGGLSLKRWYPELENSLLIAVTEMVPESKLDHFVKVLESL